MALVDNEVAPEFSFRTPYQRSPRKNLGGGVGNLHQRQGWIRREAEALRLGQVVPYTSIARCLPKAKSLTI